MPDTLIERPTADRAERERAGFAGETGAPSALVASADAETRRWGKRWLEVAGFRVTVATTLAEAAPLVRSGSTEIVVVDASLRGDSGAWACAALRELPGGAELPILALCSSHAHARRAMADGGTDVIQEPVEWPLLSERAARLVQARRTSRELARARFELAALRDGGPAEGRTDRSASVDPLTGLPNRKAYERTLDGALSGCARTGRGLAVLLVDLDRFKLINETYGRHEGNRILVETADRLKACLTRPALVGGHGVGLMTAAVGRLGGDAFSVMVSPVDQREAIERLAQVVLDAVSRPIALDGDEAYVSASLGIAVAPSDGSSAEELLQHGELAMTEARRRGGSSFRFYSRALSGARERAVKIDRLLRRSLESDALSLAYQPIIDLGSRRIVGAEALLRWHHPELGDVPPMEFIPFAEETGLMVEIGRWVLQSACRQLRQWLDDGVPPIRMAVNVSLCQLMRGNLPQLVDEALAETRLDPTLLELELSERGVVCGDPEVLRQLQALRARGVRVSVDDFGTGDAAIGNLKRFPLDTLKVDQSFVAGVLSNEDDAAIASAMIAMAHRLRLRVVAEGVEEAGQMAFLDDLECEELQGFLISPAVPAVRFRELLQRDDGTWGPPRAGRARGARPAC